MTVGIELEHADGKMCRLGACSPNQGTKAQRVVRRVRGEIPRHRPD
jgi:hypothetical protein